MENQTSSPSDTNEPTPPIPLDYGRLTSKSRKWLLGPVEWLVFLGILTLLLSIFWPSPRNRPNWYYDWYGCQNNVWDIGKALRSYAGDHNGHFPDSLEDLILSGKYSSMESFICQSTTDTRAVGKTPAEKAADLSVNGHCSYVYVGKGLTLTSDKNLPLLYEPAAVHRNGGNVLYLDGEAQFVPATVLKKIADGTPTVRPANKDLRPR